MREADHHCASRRRHARRFRCPCRCGLPLHRHRHRPRPPCCGAGGCCCGDLRHPLRPRPLRELSLLRRDAERERPPTRLPARTAGPIRGRVAEHLVPRVHRPGCRARARSVGNGARPMRSRVGAHHQSRRRSCLPRGRRPELPGHPRRAHPAARLHHRVGELGPTVGERDEGAASSGDVHPHPRREGTGPR